MFTSAHALLPLLALLPAVIHSGSPCTYLQFLGLDFTTPWLISATVYPPTMHVFANEIVEFNDDACDVFGYPIPYLVALEGNVCNSDSDGNPPIILYLNDTALFSPFIILCSDPAGCPAGFDVHVQVGCDYCRQPC